MVPKVNLARPLSEVEGGEVVYIAAAEAIVLSDRTLWVPANVPATLVSLSASPLRLYLSEDRKITAHIDEYHKFETQKQLPEIPHEGWIKADFVTV
ncbi:hypothetical protein CN1A_69 [Clavibacter phage CN1A]|uniref:Uncharacterized protein n=1 Tax=Clavibacter phage CN1A TaxID=1406793 RepID=U5PXJ5_9CAUD|nr:hypothetical protein CN1A_69 [Clavibacter phage CN1A]AGY47178.1 hypothetical protein CN1A_69 [Clavibacter phage CN1A]